MNKGRAVAPAITSAPFYRQLGLGLIAAVLAFAAVSMLSSPAAARGAPESFADLAERLLPAVVNISTEQTVEVRRRRGFPFSLPPGFGGPEQDEDEEPDTRRARSLGSGFVIGADGLIVTNNHVIEDADEVTVRFDDGHEYPAEVLGRDESTDLAILKIEADGDLPFVTFGDSDASRVGDWVVAIGNPFGLGGSVTAGILSARHRDLNAGPYDDFLQTDAPINRGNSGGPMFNLDGEVIGINTAIFSPSGGNIGIGFAVPSNQAKRVIDELKEFGSVRRGWLGVSIGPVDEDTAAGFGFDTSKGSLVNEVFPDGPADKAGIRNGDLILTFAGKDVEDWRDLPRIVAESGIDEKVKVELIRLGSKGAERKTVSMRTGERPSNDQLASANPSEIAPDEAASDMVLGMELSSLNPSARQRFDVPEDVDGVIINDVDQDSSAAEKGLRRGDIIVDVHPNKVDSVGEVKKLVNDARKDGAKTVLLRAFRGGTYFYVALKVEAQG